MTDTGKTEKHAGGRPTAYSEDFAKQAEKLCSLGATTEELADFFQVSLKTIYNWRNTHEGFLHALKVGKAPADDRIETALYQKALAGDTTAMIFWLKNRKRAEWKDRVDNVSGNLSNMSDDEIDRRAAELLAKGRGDE